MTAKEFRERTALQGEITRLTRLHSADVAEIEALRGDTRPHDLWYGWYDELTRLLYGTTGVPSHNRVMQDFTAMRDLLHESVDAWTAFAFNHQRLEAARLVDPFTPPTATTIADMVKRATPILRGADEETSCPECGGTVWHTTKFPDAQHRPGCKGKPSWADLFGDIAEQC